MEVQNDVRMLDHARAAATYEGACFCGAVRFEVQGTPVAMGYCHCDGVAGTSSRAIRCGASSTSTPP
jgi:hypothetical protein